MKSRESYKLTASLLVALALGGCSFTAPSASPGYADLDSLGSSHVDGTMSLSFGSSLLQFAAMNVDDDPQAKALLENLEGVRVKTYDVVGDEMAVAARIQEIGKQLQEQGWQPVITVKEEGEHTLVMMKGSDEQIAGMVVITCDATEAVIVNVMGNLRPEMFTRVMQAVDADVPPVHVAQRTDS